MIDEKDILNWCFTVASLDFGVFGFLYSAYAAASFQATPANPIRPPITSYLRLFCRVIVFVLVVLTVLAAITSYSSSVGLQTWIIVLCFVVLTVFSLILAYRME
jgi:Na+/H+-dicarboxylate symporter